MSKRAHSRSRKAVSLKFRRRTPPAALPGIVVADPAAAQPVVRVLSYGPDELKTETITRPEQLRELVGKRPVTWVHVVGLGNADTIEAIGQVFGLHPLAMEDVVNTHQRAKVEDYGDHLFIVARTILPGSRLETEQVALFLGKDFVVSFQECRLECVDAVEARVVAAKGEIRATGPDHLAYALLDALVDAYFPALEQYGEWLDKIDDEISNHSNRATLVQIHELRSELLMIRRSIWPFRDALSALARETSPLVAGETHLYLRDGYDHTVQIIELVETYREMCTDLRDYGLSIVNTRMSEVMKVLTVIATIFIPLSFLASLYGMNFDVAVSPWNMPELRWYYGYPFALALMATVVAGLLTLFYRRGWLGH